MRTRLENAPALRNAIRGALLVLLLFTMTPACASRQFAEAPARTLAEYRHRQVREGITVAIDPVAEEARAKDFFGFNLIQYGVFPVYVTITNNSGQPVRQSRDMFFLRNMDGTRLKPLYDHEVALPELKKRVESARVANVVSFGLMGLLAPPNMDHADMNEIDLNIRKKALKDRMVFPGETNSGFIFFYTTYPKNIERVELLALSLARIGSGELTNRIEYDFPLQGIKTKLEVPRHEPEN
ncbi:MAG: hypothetical protein HY896_03375 [Deltaproteobacteria bacterium]|nr:hypothetical protein [Deltaproteobacteria bacterium]